MPNHREVQPLYSRDDAPFESIPNDLLGQFTPDENQSAFTRLAFLPRSLMIAFEHHVNALEYVTVIVAVEGENAFRTQYLLAFAGDQLLQPRHESVRIERA